MNEIRDFWTGAVQSSIENLLKERGIVETPAAVVPETPPEPAMGDLGFPMFPMARLGLGALAAVWTLVGGMALAWGQAEVAQEIPGQDWLISHDREDLCARDDFTLRRNTAAIVRLLGIADG